LPSLSKHQSAETTKLLLIGDSGTGKTGALASLAVAGFNVRVLDLDNGLDVLKNLLMDPKSKYFQRDPKAVERVHFLTYTDPMKNVNGTLIPAKATVWQNSMKSLAHWKDEELDLGPITTWTPQDILVIDSLSNLSTAAMNFYLSMNGKLGATLTQNEWRRAIGSAQDILRKFLEMIYDKNVKCNVILISHMTFTNEMGERPGGDDAGASSSSGYPSAIGRALSPHIPRYFNNMLVMKSIGSGQSVRREIHTVPQVVGNAVVAAKNTAPMKVKPSYPIENGLADYFKDLRS